MNTSPLLSPSPFVLQEADIRCFLREVPLPFWSRPYAWAWPLAGFLLISGFFLLHAPALVRSYQVSQTIAAAAASPQPTLAAAVPAATPSPTPVPSIPDNTLAYTKISVAAPISWNNPLTGNQVYTSLQKGTAHIDGTALPGQQGMVVIVGHSSEYPWDKGLFKTIFAPLENAQLGDTFDIGYQGTTYEYKVTKRYEVKPTDLSVLQSNGTSGARLITCTPIGTSLRRLVIEAEQTYPTPTTNTPFTPKTTSGKLPS